MTWGPWKCGKDGEQRLLTPSVILFRQRKYVIKKCFGGTSLVTQWLRIRLPMQGTWVRALGQEDPMCCRASKPVHHNY